jgi:hypothetical protein
MLKNVFDGWRRGVASQGRDQNVPTGGRSSAKNGPSGFPKLPTPLVFARESDQSFPVSAFPPAAQEAVEAIQRVIQAPDGLAAQAVLGAISLAVSRLALVRSLVPNATHSTALALMTIAESGERKSAVDRQAMGGIYALIEERMRFFREEMAAYKTQIAHLPKGEPRPDEPTCPVFLANEPTYEGLLGKIEAGPGFMGLFSDDAGQVFGGHSMSKEHQAKTAAGFSKLWDFVWSSRPRASSDAPDQIPPCATTFNLMIQPVLLGQTYADDFLIGQGLLARMLPTWPASKIGTRMFRPAEAADLEAIARFQARTRTLVEHSLSFGQPPRVLELSVDAIASAAAFHDKIEAAMAKGDRLSDIRGFASKANEHALRIAGVLTLFENEEADTISLAALEGAQRMVEFYAEEFQNIRAGALADPHVDAAEKLRVWLIERVGPGGKFAKERVQQYGPANVRRKEPLERALRLLAEHGWIVRLAPGAKVDGKSRKEAFRIHPRATTEAAKRG